MGGSALVTAGQKETVLASPPGSGWRWIIKSTSSWLSNYGQLRRNAGRCLATTILTTTKFIDWKTDGTPHKPSIRSVPKSALPVASSSWD